jgi:hypothetical protein
MAEVVLGLGRDSTRPPGPKVGPSNRSRRTGSDGRAQVSAEQNPLPRDRPRTLGHSLFLSPASVSLLLTASSPRRATREFRRARKTAGGGATASLSPARASARGWARRRRVAYCGSFSRRAMSGAAAASLLGRPSRGAARRTRVGRRENPSHFFSSLLCSSPPENER